jgi:hypothetical protein
MPMKNRRHENTKIYTRIHLILCHSIEFIESRKLLVKSDLLLFLINIVRKGNENYSNIALNPLELNPFNFFKHNDIPAPLRDQSRCLML